MLKKEQDRLLSEMKECIEYNISQLISLELSISSMDLTFKALQDIATTYVSRLSLCEIIEDAQREARVIREAVIGLQETHLKKLNSKWRSEMPLSNSPQRNRSLTFIIEPKELDDSIPVE